MSAIHKSTKQYFSKDGRIPLTIEITPELEAKAKKRAKQLGMSFTEYGSRVLDRMIAQKQVKEAIQKRNEKRSFNPITFLLEKIISNINLGKRIEKRALDNPTVDMATIMEEVLEENRNKHKNPHYIYIR